MLPAGEPSALERPEGDAEVVGPRAFLEGHAVGQHVQGGHGYECVLGEAARDREADVRVSGLALAVVQAEGVHALTAPVARPAADVHLDPDPRARRPVPGLAEDDLPGEFVPRHVWEARHRELAGEDLLVGRAHHRRAHADERVPGLELRRGHVVDRDLVRRAEDDRAHRRGDHERRTAAEHRPHGWSSLMVPRSL